MSVSTATTLMLLDSRVRPGTVTLPLTTTIPGRTLTLKDSTGASGVSTITIVTSGSETFEDGTTFKTITTAYGSLTLTGNAGKWYITPQSFTGAINSISTGTLTAGSLTLTNQSLTLTNGTVAGVSTLAGATYTTAYTVTTFAGSGSSTNSDATGTNAGINGPYGSAFDTAGNMYVCDSSNKIRKITPAGVVTTFAGSGSAASTDGTGTNAAFNQPIGIAIDTAGNLYVTDAASSSAKIRMITPAGVVTTLAGSGSSTYADGTGTNASFNYPAGIVTDNAGNLYIADRSNNRIRKLVIATGVVTTLAGTGGGSSADGTGTNAGINYPYGLGFDITTNTLVVAEQGGNKIRRVTLAGVATTVAGSGTSSSLDGIGTNATFTSLCGCAVDPTGNIFVAEQSSYKVRKITPTGVVTSVAGSGSSAAVNGTGASASFSMIVGISADAYGNVFVGDANANLVRKLTAVQSNPFTTYLGSLNVSTIYANTAINAMRLGADYGIVTTLAGNGSSSDVNGTGTGAGFGQPEGIVYDPTANCLYVVGRGSTALRKVTLAGVVTTVATGFSSTRNGITVDPAGNIYIVDAGTATVKKVTPGGTVTTLAGSGAAASTDGTGTNAAFNNPYGLTCDPTGNYLYVSDASTNKIRRVTLAGAVVTTVAGTGGSGSTDGNALTTATFNTPTGLACDSAGNLYIGDQNSQKIRKLSLAGIVTTVAGSGTGSEVDGVGTNATFTNPSGMVYDPVTGNLYVADWYGYTIRKITSAGVVTTIAGQPGVSGSINGIGSAATFNQPTALAIDPAGILYSIDYGGGFYVRKITLATTLTNVIISTGGTVTAPILSTLALNTSSINGQIPIGLSTMISTVAGLNTYISSMIDPTELTSSIVGLGTSGFVSTLGLTFAIASTASGLGTLGYTSTSQLLSTTVGVYTQIASSISASNTPQFISTTAGLGSAGYVSTLSLTSTVAGLGSAGYVSTLSLTSTVAGLGSAGYVSTLSLTSTVAGLGQTYISTPSLTSTVAGLGQTYASIASLRASISTIYISAAQIQAGQLSTLNLQVCTINGAAPGTGSGGTTFVGSTVYVSAATIQASTLSSLTLQVNTGYVSSLTVDVLQIGSNAAYISLGDSIATSLSTIVVRSGVVNASQLNASTISTTTLFTQSTLLGASSLQTAIQFYGLTANYTNTVLAEQSTSATSQEFLVFRGSSATDRIRMQTTGNIVFEPGVTSRLWPNTPSNVTPALIINTASNIGILTATPAFPLDVAGIGRFQTVSTLGLNISSINGQIPGGLFTGSTIYISAAQILTSSLQAPQITATNLNVTTINGSAYSGGGGGGGTFYGSTTFLSSAQGFVSSLTVNALTIGTTAGFTVMGDVIATSLSTINLNVSTINGALPGSGSSSAFNGSTIAVSTLQLFDPALTFSSIGNLYVRSTLLLYNSTVVAGAKQVQPQMFTF
jgi:sugar lactone lactonase YvrE